MLIRRENSFVRSSGRVPRVPRVSCWDKAEAGDLEVFRQHEWRPRRPEDTDVNEVRRERGWSELISRLENSTRRT